MRIIGGAWKGRRFQAPSSIPARPTTDYAKESLFNILGHRVDWADTEVLDLFAGIGSIGAEAASRGARSVLCIDQHSRSVAWINEMAGKLGASNLAAVKSEAFQWLQRCSHTYDFIFADPPYDFEAYERLIEQVRKNTCAAHSLFVLEHRQNRSFEHVSGFEQDRIYGEVRFSFFNFASWNE